MIDKIVFDFGGVITDFTFKEYFSSLGYNNEDTEFIQKKLFGGSEWQRGMDLGKFTLEEMRQELYKSYPNKTDMINTVVNTEIKHVIPVRQDVMKYIEELKKNGYKIYGLSNLSKHVHDSFRDEYQGFDNLFDGITTSYLVGAVKPASKDPDSETIDTRIYDAFFRDNNIKPSTALFIDDNYFNIQLGQMLGMQGIHWTKEDTLDTIKIKISEAIEKSKLHDIRTAKEIDEE